MCHVVRSTLCFLYLSFSFCFCEVQNNYHKHEGTANKGIKAVQHKSTYTYKVCSRKICKIKNFFTKREFSHRFYFKLLFYIYYSKTIFHHVQCDRIFYFVFVVDCTVKLYKYNHNYLLKNCTWSIIYLPGLTIRAILLN